MLDITTVKNSMDKITALANDTKDLVSLKLELRKLHAERDEVYKKIGERLWNLKRAAELSDLENMLFASLLSAAEKLTTKIIEKENEAEKVSLIV